MTVIKTGYRFHHGLALARGQRADIMLALLLYERCIQENLRMRYVDILVSGKKNLRSCFANIVSRKNIPRNSVLVATKFQILLVLKG